MATHDVDDRTGDWFHAVALGAESHAATVETEEGMVRLAVIGPLLTARAVFSYDEARTVALAMLHASQRIREEP